MRLSAGTVLQTEMAMAGTVEGLHASGSQIWSLSTLGCRMAAAQDWSSVGTAAEYRIASAAKYNAIQQPEK